MLFENFEKVFSTYIHTDFTILGQVLSFFFSGAFSKCPHTKDVSSIEGN